MHEKKELIYSGKAKSLYTTNDPHQLIASFRDDTTAFDGGKREQLSEKGAVNNQISAHIMTFLASQGVPTHFIELLSPTETLCQKLSMFPLESVVRNIAAGSLCRRLGTQSGMVFEPPLHEWFYKSDELHDPMINDSHIVSFGWATADQIARMKALSCQICELLTAHLLEAGLVLVDMKFEFGLNAAGDILLGDEISPDSTRIWDERTQKVLDKDRFRQDMGEVVPAYQEVAERLGVALLPIV